MKGHKMPSMQESLPNVTPLIDIVMCLIIFYMLVAKIGIDTGADSKIVIPPSILGIEVKDMGNTLTLNVEPGIGGDQPLVTALLATPDNPTPFKQELKIVDQTSGRKPLLDALKYYRFGPSMRAGGQGENPEFKVIIRGQETMEYRYLEQVLISCAEAQVKNVIFNTKKVTQMVPR